MSSNDVGRIYQTGETVIRQGEVGDHMFVIQKGSVEVIRSDRGEGERLAVLDEGDFFGEMSIFEHKPRSATVRVLRRARILTIDRKTLLLRIQQNPSFALRLLETLSRRLRERNGTETRAAAKSQSGCAPSSR